MGKTWEVRYTEEFPKDRRTEEIVRKCEAGAEEQVNVPAGTFATIPITCRNQRTGAVVYRQWYAPAVKHMVREVWQLQNGPRTRELIAYKVL